MELGEQTNKVDWNKIYSGTPFRALGQDEVSACSWKEIFSRWPEGSRGFKIGGLCLGVVYKNGGLTQKFFIPKPLRSQADSKTDVMTSIAENDVDMNQAGRIYGRNRGRT